ncbi:MAG: YesL family protein [Clostridiales bacterium]|jgi:uncharacterized membrane protein YesL|nr:YesL family protein [Clostridiales bacterium]
MNKFFGIDGPLYRLGSALWDVLALNFLWLICSLPILTMGASTTALYYVTTRRVSAREGYIWRDFFRAFKENFKEASKIWLSLLAAGFVVFINMYNMLYNKGFAAKLGGAAPLLLTAQIVFFVEIITLGLYAFPILSRFHMGALSVIKTALLLQHRHLPTSVLLTAMFLAVLAAAFAVVWVPLNASALLFGAGGYAYAASFLFMRVFRIYRPGMDSDEQ